MFANKILCKFTPFNAKVTSLNEYSHSHFWFRLPLLFAFFYVLMLESSWMPCLSARIFSTLCQTWYFVMLQLCLNDGAIRTLCGRPCSPYGFQPRWWFYLWLVIHTHKPVSPVPLGGLIDFGKWVGGFWPPDPLPRGRVCTGAKQFPKFYAILRFLMDVFLKNLQFMTIKNELSVMRKKSSSRALSMYREKKSK